MLPCVSSKVSELRRWRQPSALDMEMAGHSSME
jgi:hypothetical protein